MLFNLLICVFLLLNQSTCSRRFEYLKLIHNSRLLGKIGQTGAYGVPCEKEMKCYGGLPRIKSYIAQQRKKFPDLLFLNTGNCLTTSYFSKMLKNQIGKLMGKIGLDAMALGSWELNFHIRDLKNFIQNIHIPVLCANLDISYTPELFPLRNLKKWIIFDFEARNLSIAVIGFVETGVQYKSNLDDIQLLPLVPTMNQEIEVIKSLVKTNLIIIALGEIGDATQLSLDCPEIDIIISEDKDSVMTNNESLPLLNYEGLSRKYPEYHRDFHLNRRQDTFFLTNYGHSIYIGEAMIQFDYTKDQINIRGDTVLLDSIFPQDQALLQEVKDSLEPIAIYNESFIITYTRVKLSSEKCYLGECALYNLITEAVAFCQMQYSYTVVNTSYWTDTSIVLIHDNGYKVQLGNDDGEISIKDVYKVAPNRDYFYVVSIASETLRRALEHSASFFASKTERGSLHMFGLRVVYNLSAFSGSRVVSISVLCSECNIPKYEPWKQNSFYNVILSGFLYHGGLGYIFKEDRETLKSILPTNDFYSLLNFLKSKTIHFPKLDGRIKFIPRRLSTYL